MTDLQPGPELDFRVIEQVMGGTVYRYHEEGSKAYDAWYVEFKRGNPKAFYWANGEDILCRYAGIDDTTDAPYAEDWSPSVCIKDAWEVMEKCPSRFDLHRSEGSWNCYWWDGNGYNVHAEGETAPHAICLAALKAVGAEVPA